MLLSLVVALTAGQPLSNEARYDLTCVEAGIFTSIKHKTGTPTGDTVYGIMQFYVGRLSGRDGSIKWLKRAFSEMDNHRESELYYAETLTGCQEKMSDQLATN